VSVPGCDPCLYGLITVEGEDVWKRLEGRFPSESSTR
jgi:hypothetical protein